MKKIAILVIVLLLLSIVAFSGCSFEGREDNTLSSKKTTTNCGIGGCKTQTKQCPFWNRDC